MKAALVILDGWALGPGSERGRAPDRSNGDRSDETDDEASDPRDDRDRLDAVQAADTPNFDRYRTRGGFGTLETHGRRVGLPDCQMGNSEVGHLNIGAGRVVKQDSTRITDAIDDGSLFENDALRSAFDYARERDGRVHLLGLVSDGGVHSRLDHIAALIELAAREDVPASTHAFTDGRDTDPKSAPSHLSDLQAVVEEHGTGEVATVSGRYYAMDRDENWERTKRAYDAVVNREADHVARTPVAAVEASYDRGDTDEFVEPTLVEGGPALTDGDAALFVNFRADRARQFTRMLADIRPEWDDETDPPDVRVVTMTEYDRTFDLPVAFRPRQPGDTLGAVLAEQGLTQLRIAETEKYAHVTYFLNGGREVTFEGERREIVPSPDVPTYDLQPEMSAPEVTDAAVRIVRTDDPDVLVLNYANPDMVGHTGDFDAAVAAVEAVDEQLGRLVGTLLDAGAHVLVTADHGNADDMGRPGDPHTAHTTNPVPLVYLSPVRTEQTGEPREGGTLADVAPTMLELLDVEKPDAMTGESLLED